MPDTRCWILGGRDPVEADPARLAMSYGDGEISELVDTRGLDIGPGIRIALLSMGDHLHYGKVRGGALIAVRTDLNPKGRADG